MEKIISKFKSIFVPREENNYRPKFLDGRVLFYFALVLLVLKLVTVPALMYFPKTVFFADITRMALIESVNQERKALGMGILKENLILNKAAILKAKDMLENDYFAHNSPEGITPWHWFKSAGYNYRVAGENLAVGFLDSEEVHQAWLDSPSHKENLLNPKYKEVGIAVISGDFQGGQTEVVVQLFGSPQALFVPQEEKKKIVKNADEKEDILSEQKELNKELNEEVFVDNNLEQPELVFGSEENNDNNNLEQPELVLGLGENNIDSNSFPYLVSFIASNYYGFFQKTIYGLLIFVIISLMINIFVRFDVQHKDLIFKTGCFVALLLLFIMIDKLTIIQFIPHNLQIF